MSNFKVEDFEMSRAFMQRLTELAKKEELTMSLLIKSTKLNHSIISKHFNQFKNLNLVQEKKFG